MDMTKRPEYQQAEQVNAIRSREQHRQGELGTYCSFLQRLVLHWRLSVPYFSAITVNSIYPSVSLFFRVWNEQQSRQTGKLLVRALCLSKSQSHAFNPLIAFTSSTSISPTVSTASTASIYYLLSVGTLSPTGDLV